MTNVSLPFRKVLIAIELFQVEHMPASRRSLAVALLPGHTRVPCSCLTIKFGVIRAYRSSPKLPASRNSSSVTNGSMFLTRRSSISLMKKSLMPATASDKRIRVFRDHTLYRAEIESANAAYLSISADSCAPPSVMLFETTPLPPKTRGEGLTDSSFRQTIISHSEYDPVKGVIQPACLDYAVVVLIDGGGENHVNRIKALFQPRLPVAARRTATGGRTSCGSISCTSIPPSPTRWAGISTTPKSSRVST